MFILLTLELITYKKCVYLPLGKILEEEILVNLNKKFFNKKYCEGCDVLRNVWIECFVNLLNSSNIGNKRIN
ncbi:hypothetical protein Mgra_00006778 [Meloidogyne graminicola]|uniref:Uncharacterized protein n=1 Tax=Meloidogyne graminicola TaxID=189291 RepID=A0A8S9ZKD0_9BILA|nr:hypothetical protein Mgra_00006778 [Meloidogyne graminicola]